MNRKLFAYAAAALALSSTSFGCSSSSDAGPTTSTDKCKAAGTSYPTTGCGTTAGATLVNYSFKGRMTGIASPSQTVTMNDLYDPDGKKGNRFLYFNAAAFWCANCKEDAKQLVAMNAKYGPKGVKIMTVVMQKSDRSPADDSDVDAWINTFKLDSIVVSDPTQLLGAFFDVNTMPLNVIVDLKTMKIVKVSTGADLPGVQAQLDALTAG